MEKLKQNHVRRGIRKYPRNYKWGILFISPWLLGFFGLQLYPLLQSLYYSFTDFSILSDGKWIGTQNYADLFTKDRYFWKSFTLTIKYALMTVPMKLLFALFIAMLLNMRLKCINVFRTIYYLPSIMGGSVAVSILWKFMFMKEGIVNRFLGILGIPAINWLGMPDTALLTISLLDSMAVWIFYGFVLSRIKKCTARLV